MFVFQLSRRFSLVIVNKDANSRNIDMENENAVKKNCKDKLLSKQDLKDSTTCAQDNGLRLCCGKVIKPETLLFALTVAGRICLRFAS